MGAGVVSDGLLKKVFYILRFNLSLESVLRVIVALSAVVIFASSANPFNMDTCFGK
ncbi:hypothetical protein AGMMS50222_08790 [Endomicrobiia bacterium]|nr:hypothetical protein AGMMS49531_01300 [Endomicrobiia bacterium]GHT66299.1 hypothetical protein AGMMS49556_07100 [Endomicrobiia bacterium]GHT71337.1 hypothetical protein AGMMS49950_07780 [Endomicrobiia bacterium]GHT76364.1 hypothetical protein AGMMS50222_08790 [Endomicrobiia bacterium]